MVEPDKVLHNAMMTAPEFVLETGAYENLKAVLITRNLSYNAISWSKRKG